ncbi:MAG: CoA transferase [Ardenticatenales bacterium]|nr:CoA transferase [Ardenticatenales bacterium]
MPLSTLKILDFTTLLPGPYATMMLADLGADVLRIEAPNRPDLTRLLPPFASDGQSAGQGLLNRNKRSLGLNLKADGAVDIVHKLIREQGYDIIVEGSRPGVMERLGVGYEALSVICPSLIYCSLTGYGQNGPYRDRAGHDLNYLALAGMLAQYGRRGGDVPPPLPTQVADIGGGSLHLVIGLLAAVIRRGATGAGSQVDIAMHDGALAWNSLAMASYLVGDEPPAPEGTLLNGGSFYDLYETRDGRWLSVGSLEPKFWLAFCAAIDRPELGPRGLDLTLANQQAFKAELRATIQAKTLAEWQTIFANIDACVEPVLSAAEAVDHPQTKARAMVVTVPQADGHAQRQIGSPIKLTGHTPTYRHTGSAVGADTAAVLAWLGYGEKEIAALKGAGVVV